MRIRVCKYKPSYDELIADIMESGDGWAEFCKEVKISHSTLNHWINNHESFKFAYEIGQMMSLAWWEKLGKNNIENPKFNSYLWQRMMFNKFKKHYVEKGRPIIMETLYKLLQENPNASFDEQAKAIVKDMCDGKMTAEESEKAVNVIRGNTEIKKISELEQMVQDITDTLKKQGKL